MIARQWGTKTAARGAALSAVLALYTVVVIAVPAARTRLPSATGRVALEVAVVAAMGGAAVLMALLQRTGRSTGRDAFVAALVVQCLNNVVYGVAPAVLGEAVSLSRSYYPWLAGRYIAGLLLLAAAVRIKYWRVRTTVVIAAVAVGAVDLLIGRADLPPPPALGTSGITVSAFHYALEVPPLIMFAVGAIAAGRYAQATGEPLERWFTLSLLVGVFTQVHEALFPAALGRVITSADALRATAALMLLIGVIAQVQRLQVQRDRALQLLQEDLRASRRSLDHARQAREREAAFVSVITHELSSPIAAISAQAHVLESLGDDRTAPHVNAVVREAQRLGGLVRRMDELRNLEDDDFAVHRRPVAVVPLLDEVASFGRGLPGNHVVTVDAVPSRVSADPVRLGQVLRNLVVNASRYAPAGSPITITGRVEDARYVMTVIDQGPGLGTDDVEGLFEAWTRGESAADAEGTGLGLHVAQRIVAAHGGSLEFVDPSLPGARARVEVELA